MTIVVDTNILPQSGDLNSVEIQVLVAIAHETGHELILPSLVLEEASSQRRREIEKAFDALLAATKLARRYASIPLPPDMPIPGELAGAYEDELKRIFSIAPLPEGAGDEALRREVHRLRPAREGKGARDAAIWLIAKDVHARSGGQTLFLSENIKDFGSQGDLHDDLRREVDHFAGDFIYCRNVADVLDTLAAAEAPFVDVDYLSANAGVGEAVASAILAADDLAALALRADLTPPPTSAEVRAVPTFVSDTRAFSLEGRRVAVAWTKWQLSMSETRTPSRSASTELAIEASAQILIREEVGGTSPTAEVLAIRGLRHLD